MADLDWATVALYFGALVAAVLGLCGLSMRATKGSNNPARNERTAR